MKKLIQLIFTLTALAAFVTLAKAQESDDWRYRIYGAFSNQNFSNSNFQGWNAGGEVKVLSYERFTVSGVIDGGGSYKEGSGAYFHQLQAGPQFAARIGNVSPFVRGLFGVTRFTVSGLGGVNKFTPSVGAGLDIHLTRRLFVSPAVVDFQYPEDTNLRFTRYTARIGAQF